MLNNFTNETLNGVAKYRLKKGTIIIDENIELELMNEVVAQGTPISAESINPIIDSINTMVESGENANGSYIKYSDGTMICYASKLFANVNIDKEWGNGGVIKTSPVLIFENYAVNFVREPQTLLYSKSMGWLIGTGDSLVNCAKFVFIRPGNTTNFNLYASYIAIGKWK